MITNAAIDKCDTLDGVADRVIENPLACDFDIESLECTDPITIDSAACLTKEQIEQAKKIYKGPENPRTGASLYPGFSVGSEAGWSYQQSLLAGAVTIPLLQHLAFDLTYNASKFDWDGDVDTVDSKIGTLIDGISPNLEAFRVQGGKMVVTQAWADQFNAALWPIQHREKISKEMNGNLDDWFALFMVPGEYCAPSAFFAYTARHISMTLISFMSMVANLLASGGGHCTSSPQYPQVPVCASSFIPL